jgi:ABC-2 type transport system ATP-binding protein
MALVDEENAIKVDNITKSFRIPIEGSTGLKQRLINFLKGRKGYREFTPLKNISFEIKKGEFFGIVGRNGSGKSTLLKTIAGIYAPDKGAVSINGSLVPFIELGVGFNPELSGRENVFLNGALLGFSRREMESMYDEIVDFAELHDFMDERLKNYSSGMQVRLAFSIAIQAKGDILLLDEVLAVGDANFQKKCFDYFRKLKLENKTVILVSHSMDSVANFCTKALMLDSGEIAVMGSVEEVTDAYIESNIEDSHPGEKEAEQKEEFKLIRSVGLVDENGRPIDRFMTGDPFNVKVEFSDTTTDELNIGIGLHSDAHGYVFGYNTQMDGVDVDKDRGVVVLKFKELPILHGSYYINVVLFGADETAPLDFAPRILAFETYSTGKQKRYRGTVYMEHTWDDKVEE